MKAKDGTIEVKNGNVFVEEPKGAGRYPQIKSGEFVNIYVDGELITDEQVVFNDSEIRIEKVEKKAVKDFKISVEEKGLKAFLEVNIQPELKIEIKDLPPSNSAAVDGFIKEKNYPEISQSEISIFLLKNRIRYGIKNNVIREIVNKKKNGRFLIAEGKNAVKGRDAEINPVKNDERELSSDFNCITSFVKGEVIAVKKPAKKGREGINVYKEKIPAPEAVDYQMAAGPGIKIIESGKKAVAVQSGRPKIEKKGKKFIISIIPQYLIDGDVDKTTGSIKYKGDLIVSGGIFDFFDVQIGNRLQVNKSITGSNAVAKGDILVKENIIHSQITAGFQLKEELLNNIKELHSSLKNLLQAVDEITGAVKNNKNSFLHKNMQIGRILRLLLIDKFKTIPELLDKTAAEVDSYQINKEDAELIIKMKQKFKGYKNILNFKNIEPFQNLIEVLEDIIDSQYNLKESHVYANYIQNSTITASGNIVIMNKGCYNSDINSGQNIINIGKKGFLKGGKYSAERYIYLNEVGGHLSRTEFKVGKGIYIKNLDGSIKVSSENDVLIRNNPCKNLYLTVDKAGKLLQEAGTPNFERLREISTYKQIPFVRER
ncbi:MAG: flagellar assembly protein A [Bacillota bacterium]